MLIQDSTSPLYKRVKEHLCARMLDGTYGPETQLPTEQALCDMFEVSRITVRQALEELRQEGLVKKVHGRGTFVSPPRAYQNVDALQGFSEAMAPLGHKVSNQLEGLRYLEAREEIRSRLDMEEGARVAEIKRVRFLDGEAISFETTYIGEPLARQLTSADLATQDIFRLLEERSQVRVNHANVAMDAIPADEETAAALGLAPLTPILRIERHVFDAHGHPILFEYLHFRGDAFQYRMRIDRDPASKRAAQR
ncbi:GntR family transcriptional regulator [Caballeronia sp. LjRoot34]